MNSTANGRPLYEDLDTTFVNLWSLLRNLTQRGFVGRVRVDLDDYSAEVFLTGSSTPMVHEIDRKTGRDTIEESALHRVVLRARETPGKITVFEGVDEAAPSTPSSSQADDQPDPKPPVHDNFTERTVAPPQFAAPEFDIRRVEKLIDTNGVTELDADFNSTIALGGELIAAVERGVNATGENFTSVFDQVRVQLADDFSFLDPMSNAFAYANGVASLNQQLSPAIFVSGLSESLRRVVNTVASGTRERRVRERMALELLGVARSRKRALEQSQFGLQLDRIAGTKVI